MSYRHRRGPLAPALVALLHAVSCKPSEAPTPPSSAMIQAGQSTTASPPSERWIQRWVPPKTSGHPRVFFGDGSDAVAVYRSGVRRATADVGTTVGIDVSTVPMMNMAQAESGVLWALRNGTVLRSPTTTGSLVRVEGLEAESVAVVGETGYACTKGGDLVSVAMSGTPSVRSSGRPCTSVGGSEEVLAVEYPPGVWSPDVSAQANAGSVIGGPEWGYPAEPDAVDRTDRLISSWRGRDGVLYGLDGRAVRFLDAGGSWVRVPRPRGLSCEFFPTVDGFVASCAGLPPESSRAHRLFTYTDRWTQTFAGAPSPDQRRAHAAVSQVDGSVVLDRPCDLDWALQPQDTAEAPALCVVEAGHPPRTLRSWSTPGAAGADNDCNDLVTDCARYPSARSERLSLEGYQHPYLLVDHGNSGVYVLDVRSGKIAPSITEGCRSPRWVGPGWLQCISPTTAPKPALVLRRVDGDEARTVALPPLARRAAFADARRGLAAGHTAEALWTTADGGTTWDPAHLEIDGHPSHLRLERPQCTNVVCSARPFVWANEAVLGRFELPETRFLAPREPATETEVRSW